MSKAKIKYVNKEEINKSLSYLERLQNSGGGAGGSSSFASLTGNPTDNTNLATALSSIPEGYDYVIEKVGSTTYARPRANSGLSPISNTSSYTVIQGAVNALTPAGAQGTGGGSIFISSGTYTLSNEIVVAGWESSNPPFSQINITGAGYSTRILQPTASKNAFKCNNRVSGCIRNMFIGVSAGALSGILMAADGAASEISVFKFIVDNVMIISSGSAPAFYAKNFFALDVPNLWAECDQHHGVMLENTTTTGINYGNSHFGQLNAKGKSTTPYADIALISDIANHPINLIEFDAAYTGTGFYGVYMRGAASNTFAFLDAEYTPHPIHLADGASGVENYGNTFLSGLLYVDPSGTGIYCSQKSAGNRFLALRVEGDATVQVITDLQEFRQANEYDLGLGFEIDATKIAITTTTQTPIKYKKASDGITVLRGPSVSAGTLGDDPLLNALRAMGSPLKALSVGINMNEANAAAAMVDGNGKFQAVWLPSAGTITGIGFILRTVGSFTSDQVNAIGLYSFNNGTITKVAETANSDAFWKGTAQMTQVALSAPYNAAAGLYYVVFLYNSSAQTTAPAVGVGVTLNSTTQSLAFATNGGKLMGNILGTFNSLPSSVDLSGVQTGNTPIFAALY